MPAPTLALRLSAAFALQVLIGLGGPLPPLPRLALPLADRSAVVSLLTPAIALHA
ncbi:hypothetical protein [Pararhodobacter sp.]|uniref:hypothetical protein n=1 Tax=Pararhodobacter sp. TaxID=2127056 RepID=UPI002FE0A5A6